MYYNLVFLTGILLARRFCSVLYTEVPDVLSVFEFCIYYMGFLKQSYLWCVTKLNLPIVYQALQRHYSDVRKNFVTHKYVTKIVVNRHLVQYAREGDNHSSN